MTKTMKSFALAAMSALVLSLIIGIAPAFADFSFNDNSTDVKYTITETYTVTVPADITFASDNLSDAKAVNASDVVIANDKKLSIKVSSANGYALKYEGSHVGYTVTPTGGTALSSTNTEVLSVAAGTTSGQVTLNFATDGAGFTKAGDHTDTLTFSCSVDSVS